MLVYSTNKELNRQISAPSTFTIVIRKCRKFLNMLADNGLMCEIEQSYSGSQYWVFFNKEGEIKFKLRMSNHALGEYNYLPAGVIANSDIATVYSDVLKAIEIIKNMTKQDNEYLFSNRVVSDLCINNRFYTKKTITT